MENPFIKTSIPHYDLNSDVDLLKILFSIDNFKLLLSSKNPKFFLNFSGYISDENDLFSIDNLILKGSNFLKQKNEKEFYLIQSFYSDIPTPKVLKIQSNHFLLIFPGRNKSLSNWLNGFGPTETNSFLYLIDYLKTDLKIEVNGNIPLL